MPLRSRGVARRLLVAITQKTLSHHLAGLRTAGLVFSHRSGKCIEHEAAAPRVRYQRHDDWNFSLTVTAPGGAEAVTLTVGISRGNDRAP